MQDLVQNHGFFELLQFMGPKLLFAILCGGIIGIEREIKHKAAGLKTNILICVGSTVFTALSILMSETNAVAHGAAYGDPARLAAQVVSGIGFLGGGAIIRSGENITGLTTAATIWTVAAIGVAIGMGLGPLAFISAITVVVVLTLVTIFEERTIRKMHFFRCRIRIREGEEATRKRVQELMVSHTLHVDRLDVRQEGADEVVHFSYRGAAHENRRFLLGLWNLQGVLEVHPE